MEWIYRFTDSTLREHWLFEPAMTIGRLTGRYVACCGATLLPASLAAPPARACHRCRRSPLLV
jgi:hypothetical protein